MATREVRVNWSKTLAEEPATGHNRWHPEIPPAVSCDPGDEVVLATRDAFDGQMGPSATLETVAAPNLNVVHPLTGPVYVNGAEPGDLLEVEVLEVEPDRYGYTVQVPGFGFLRDEFPDPFMVRWRNADGWATSDDLPGVRIPGAPFMGTIGLAPTGACCRRPPPASRRPWTAAASCSLRTRPTRSRRTPPSPARRCAPSRRGRPPATSTSSSSAPAPGC